ncbi:ABC transporter substrate-binding protein [Tessaracoccus rhinocerotis]|uniref:ABC transporter substrate-binding protein n=1 Tax=Tessaracoccus rhinocerotis TaxID=1689449 RepID=A0A553K4F9_9ACTN|nr:ABC transporter substrate-binding protein [Tessaracoccus rhinocerotis]TRY19577.1 ABC transporter substrate-binding protein [Tessaracoccus rhinocerotis]
MQFSRRALFGTTAAVAVAGTLAACNASPSGTNGADGDTIKLGVNYELSGDVATYGQASVAGIKMAIEEVNAAGGIDGKQIEIVEVDNKSDAAEATTLATRLMSQDGVIACMGPATSGNFKATIPVAQDNQVPVVSGSATADDVTVDADGVKEYAFRICFNDSFQGTIMAQFADENLSAGTAVIIQDNSSDYATGLAAAFTAEFEKRGGSIAATEGFTAGDTDFNSILTRLRGETFDVIYLPGYYSEAGLIIKQARDLGIDAPILGADGFDSPTLLELAGTGPLNEVYFTNHYSSIDEDPAVVDFISAFQEANGEEPNAFHALGYDLGKFVADAVSRASELTGEAVKTAMAETQGFTGVTGTFDMDENHNPVKSIVVIGLADGVQATSEKIG